MATTVEFAKTNPPPGLQSVPVTTFTVTSATAGGESTPPSRRAWSRSSSCKVEVKSV